MDDKNKLDKLKEEYLNIDIPIELDYIVDREIRKNTNSKKVISMNKYSRIITSIASVFVFTLIINTNESFADSLSNIPIVKNVINVLKLSNYNIREGNVEISVDTPKIEGLENKELEFELNEKFKDEGNKLYDEYVEKIKEYEGLNMQGGETLEHWYEVKTDTEEILSISLYTYYSQASSNTIGQYYTLNKETEEVLTLEGMFYGTDYIDVISEEIKRQMRVNMENDPNKIYWIDGKGEFSADFNKIDKNQHFYINENNNLVICFDKYDTAPGYMGILEFIIDEDITKTLLK